MRVKISALDDLELAPFLDGEYPTLSERGVHCYSPGGTLILDSDHPRAADDVEAWRTIGAHKLDPACRLIDELMIEGGLLRISTVYLGLDHQWRPGLPIPIWETMIFANDDWGDLYCWRYSTPAAAKAGHERVVDILRTALEGR